MHEKVFYRLLRALIDRMREGEVVYLHADQDSPILFLISAALLCTLPLRELTCYLCSPPITNLVITVLLLHHHHHLCHLLV